MNILVMIRFNFISLSRLLILLSVFRNIMLIYRIANIAFLSVNVIAENAIIHFHKISILGVYKIDNGIPSLSK